MGVFDNNIISRSLLVKHAYDVHIYFIGNPVNLRNSLLYKKLWGDIKETEIPVAQLIRNIFENCTLDMFMMWTKEKENGLQRSLRKFLHKHYFRPYALKHMFFYNSKNEDWSLGFNFYTNRRGNSKLYIEFVRK